MLLEKQQNGLKSLVVLFDRVINDVKCDKVIVNDKLTKTRL